MIRSLNDLKKGDNKNKEETKKTNSYSGGASRYGAVFFNPPAEWP